MARVCEPRNSTVVLPKHMLIYMYLVKATRSDDRNRKKPCSNNKHLFKQTSTQLIPNSKAPRIKYFQE